MSQRTAKNLIDTICHVVRADSSAGAVLRDLGRQACDDRSLVVLVDDFDVVGKIVLGRLKSYLAGNPSLASELAGNLAESSFVICRADDPVPRLAALWSDRNPDVILVTDHEGRVRGAIRDLPD